MSDDAVEDASAPPAEAARFRGVTKTKKSGKPVWLARFNFNCVRRVFGHYPTPELAARAYDVAQLKLRGTAAGARYINYPLKDYLDAGAGDSLKWRDSWFFGTLAEKITTLDLGYGPTDGPPRPTFRLATGERKRALPAEWVLPEGGPMGGAPSLTQSARRARAAARDARAAAEPAPPLPFFDNEIGKRRMLRWAPARWAYLRELFSEELERPPGRRFFPKKKCSDAADKFNVHPDLGPAPGEPRFDMERVKQALRHIDADDVKKAREEKEAAAVAAAADALAAAAAAAAAGDGGTASSAPSPAKRARVGAAPAAQPSAEPPSAESPPALSLQAPEAQAPPPNPLEFVHQAHETLDFLHEAASKLSRDNGATQAVWQLVADDTAAMAAAVQAHASQVSAELGYLIHSPASPFVTAAIGSADAAAGAAGAAAAAVAGYAAAFQDGAAGPDCPTDILGTIKKAADLMEAHVRALTEFEVQSAAVQAEAVAAAGAAGATGLPPPPTE